MFHVISGKMQLFNMMWVQKARLGKKQRHLMFLHNHSSDDVPTLGDVVSLMAASNENLVRPIGCEWNRNARASTDLLDRKYNVCPGMHGVRAWNGVPDAGRVTAAGKEGGHSVGKRRIDNDNEFR